MMVQPGPELDALVAERVMGLESVSTPGFNILVGWRPKGLNVGVGPLKPYSTDIAAAWDVIEKFRGQPFKILALRAISRDDWDGWMVEVRSQSQCARTLPLALCLAALELCQK